jgi:single-strand DNA-binding protein
MNCINSLIVEGVVVGEPHYLEATQRLEFAIDSTRIHKNESGEDVTEHSQFDNVAYGDYGKSILNPLKNCKSVRVVGRLKQEKWEDSESVSHSRVYIVVEHIEFRRTK